VSGIETAINRGNVSEILEHVGKEKGIGLQIQVVVILVGLSTEGSPNVLGARVLVVCDTLLIHLAIERVFGRQLGAIDFVERAEPFIKEYPIREQQFVRSEAQSTDTFFRAMVVMPDFVIIFRECFATVETR
jgi:hypothetical protein